ncbi:putative quinol monooxygenase [Candidatus Nitrosocosmicus franklandus]|uniref:Antibiotic biosynthesis monooxygenase n=1 Tax=Candidatus Nitrosocosmicus franklandianus TaxID=1798806 RepID=A0A484I6F8_9ARCH|nr:putative quinol monooxygenase [Candidatus Nitrosocosmicus franklandus]VFJ12703.1 Antibiotic biosynthesis monooxygenase [Candidatus Nitrosocosmicus franklandus]
MEKTNENSSFRVLATLEAKSESRQELMDFLVSLVIPARKEEGNISYDLYRSTQNPNEFLFDEVWRTKGDFDRHYDSLKSQNNRERVRGLLAKPLEINTYLRVTE